MGNMQKRFEDISAVIADVVKAYDVLEVYVFGSYARGEQTTESDIDLRFACGPSITFGDLADIASELESRLHVPVEIVTNPLEKMRPKFRERVLKDEVRLYEAA